MHQDNSDDIHGDDKDIKYGNEPLITGHQAEIIEAVQEDGGKQRQTQITEAGSGIAHGFCVAGAAVEISHENGKHQVSGNRGHSSEEDDGGILQTEKIRHVFDGRKAHGGKGGVHDAVEFVIEFLLPPGVAEHEDIFEGFLCHGGADEGHAEGQRILVFDRSGIKIQFDILIDGVFHEDDRDDACRTKKEKCYQYPWRLLFKGLGFVDIKQHGSNRQKRHREQISRFHVMIPFRIDKYRIVHYPWL